MLGPIFLRELATVPRRAGHYPSRLALVGLLGVLGVTAWQATVGFTRDATLGETARFGLLLFQILASTCNSCSADLLLGPVRRERRSAQEKDRRTFVLLLITDMRDPEIVLGKLLGSAAADRGACSLVCIAGAGDDAFARRGRRRTQVAGGAPRCSRRPAFAAGSLGGVVALWRDRTFQALALSVLFHGALSDRADPRSRRWRPGRRSDAGAPGLGLGPRQLASTRSPRSLAVLEPAGGGAGPGSPPAYRLRGCDAPRPGGHLERLFALVQAAGSGTRAASR